MALPLALPLAPVVSSGAGAAAATFIAGSSLILADSIYGFRRTPTLPPLTGLEGAATLAEKVADYLDGARVPVGFPLPPPWKPEATALGLAASAFGIWDKLGSALAQLWGLLGGANRVPTFVSNLPWEIDFPVVGNYSPTGVTTLTVSNNRFVSSSRSGPQFPACSADFLTNPAGPNNVRQVTGLQGMGYIRGGTADCGGHSQLTVVYYGANGQQVNGASLSSSSPFHKRWAGTLTATTTAPDATPTQTAVVEPLPDRGYLTALLEPEPAPATLPPLPLPLIAPAFVPLPEPEPEVAPAEPGPTTPTVPTIQPLTVPTVQPWLLPGTPLAPQPTNQGTLVEPAAAPAPVTSPDAIFPYPGAAPLVGNGPQTSPEEMAKELGRIEAKLELLLRAPTGPGGDLADLIGSLLGPLGNLIASFFDGAPAGQYKLIGPCEVDEDGQPIVPPVELYAPYEETSDNTSAVIARLDALAELLQHHKNLRQPSCKNPPPQGELVTVNFEQID